jgi:hypothetical protein
MQILVQMHGLLCGQRRIWRVRADRIEEKSACAPDARLWGKYLRACVKSPRRKIRMDFSPISGELAGKQVGRGRFVNLQVNKRKRKANKAQMREELIPSPQYGRQSVCTQFVTV